MNNLKTLSFTPNDSNTWTTTYNGRYFMVYQFHYGFVTNEISEQKKAIDMLYGGKDWEAVEKDILEFCEKNK
jgi:hypothetical protein